MDLGPRIGLVCATASLIGWRATGKEVGEWIPATASDVGRSRCDVGLAVGQFLDGARTRCPDLARTARHGGGRWQHGNQGCDPTGRLSWLAAGPASVVSGRGLRTAPDAMVAGPALEKKLRQLQTRVHMVGVFQTARKQRRNPPMRESTSSAGRNVRSRGDRLSRLQFSVPEPQGPHLSKRQISGQRSGFLVPHSRAWLRR